MAAPRKSWLHTMGERPTADLIVLALTVVVCVSVIILVGGLIWIRIAAPHVDISPLARQLGQFLSSIIAVIVGYVAGRGVNDERTTLGKPKVPPLDE